MRRTASEVLRSLEIRVARLERLAKSYDSDFEMVMKNHQRYWMKIAENDIKQKINERNMFFPDGDYPAGTSDEDIRKLYITKTYDSFYSMFSKFKDLIAKKDSAGLKKYLQHDNKLYKAMVSKLLNVVLPKSNKETFPLIDQLLR